MNRNLKTLLSKQMLLSGVLFAVSSSSWANMKSLQQPQSAIHSGTTLVNSTPSPSSTSNSSVTLDFSRQNAESWDVKGRSVNIMENCLQGDVITGLEWDNVRLETVGGSYLSEATIKFSDSSGTGGIELSVGFGTESAGSQVFSSNGLFDLTDNFVADIPSASDKQFYLEFFELVDDVENQIDAYYRSGTVTIWGVNLTPNSSCPYIASSATGADIAVSMTGSDEAYKLDSSLNVELEVQNHGPEEASNVQLDLLFPQRVEYVSSSCSNQTEGSVNESKVSFDLENMDSDSSLTCNVELRITSYGPIEMQSTASADNDSNASNNNSNIIFGGAILVIPTLSFWGMMIMISMIALVGWRRRLN